MATTPLLDENPVALVVEDKPKSLEDKIHLLQAIGFEVRSADSAQKALEDIQSTQTLDLVMTDINLDPNKPGDRSGVGLARSIRQRIQEGKPKIPVVGYSALFGEGGYGGLQEDEVENFDDYLPKGSSSSEIEHRVQSWHTLAITGRRERALLAAEDMNRLMTKYQLPQRDFGTILVKPNTNVYSFQETSADELMKKAGYHLHIVEPGTPRPLVGGASTAQAEVIKSLAMWVKRNAELTVAEVNGYPMLYGFGDTENEAVSQVLLLMDGFRQELIVQEPTEETLMGPARKLRDFLKQVFG